MFSVPSAMTAMLKRLLSQRNSSMYSADEVFSEENKKRTVEQFSSMKPIRMTSQEPRDKAAVLIPLCEVDGKVSLLYTLRAANLKSHRGQVSFPGGKKDDDDDTLKDAALRETEEELGIQSDNIDVWATGSSIISKRKMTVLPVIGRILNEIKISELNVNYSEVEEVFAVSLEDLCNPAYLRYTQFRSGASLPVFLGGKRRIWGLTGLITNRCLLSLLPPQAYSHKIKFIPHVKSNIKPSAAYD
ncbi:unnamed protein product [Psylliodes chrysocephalus]|uniref:Nudix hydrolase domain-containing protein n=1 Tax=Psylliodes chrysocephalus TaxID=3402493 RepID=A0A9P0CUC3_9CUCU|nr:unnamed protein product [Psylliodes chrysocephala]